MKRLNITLSEEDEADIEKLRKHFGLASRSAAIRFAVRAEVSRMEFLARGGRIDSHIDSHGDPQPKNKSG
jgi:Arc/MetJ-type ribon-helix-helix transcriptional regulator